MVYHAPATCEAQPLWPPDDTEESVVGTPWHQYTITNLRWGINEAAASEAAPGQPPPWQALSQTMITGLARPDGSRYTVPPDVFVYLRPMDPYRGSIPLEEDGPPALVVEVAGDATYGSDLDLRAGKGWSYAHAGVREYLVLDPTGVYLAERGRGWRLAGGVYVPWRRDERGRWRSAVIGVALAVEGDLVSVYRRDGERQLREGEVHAALAREREALARKDAEIAELRRRLEERG
jgi:Uma2 family endonuclease